MSVRKQTPNRTMHHDDPRRLHQGTPASTARPAARPTHTWQHPCTPNTRQHTILCRRARAQPPPMQSHPPRAPSAVGDGSSGTCRSQQLCRCRQEPRVCICCREMQQDQGVLSAGAPPPPAGSVTSRSRASGEPPCTSQTTCPMPHGQQRPRQQRSTPHSGGTRSMTTRHALHAAPTP